MRYFCCDERRREAVRATNVYNGIEYLEVVDTGATNEADRQRILRVTFLKPPQPPLDAITPLDVHIEGGTRVTGIEVEDVTYDGDVLVVTVDRPGDYSIYTLRLGDIGGQPLAGLDPLLASVEFSFKVECPTDFDCLTEQVCPPELLDEPAIDYLARDYASFRQLMLDRMSVVLPDWRERNPADLGIALIEALAYTADHLSYELDAIGMEATLATARRRASARRHARMVDYAMHDGANARTWVQIEVDAVNVVVPSGTPLYTRVPGLGTLIPAASDDERKALQFGPIIFETMHEATLHDDLNQLDFYTWGDRDCCLPAGSTSATLLGHVPHLETGMVLVFVEKRGPRTGNEADADPQHRHAVRLTDVQPGADPIGSWFEDPLAPATPVDITEIAWADEDALPFPLCVSATAHDGDYHDDVSIALGNIVLADHGRTIEQPELLVPEPDPRLAVAVASAGAGSHCDPAEPVPAPPRFTPLLHEVPLTMAATTGKLRPSADERQWEQFDPTKPAASVFQWETRHVLPEVYLDEPAKGRRWYPRRDLLASDAFAPEFVVEIDPDGRARLRFGDDEYGMRPPAGAHLDATYRIGNGPTGNIGADALHHIGWSDTAILGVSNPMPARGGVAPESIEHVRRIAPSAFWIQRRAVTPADYAEVAERHWQVQRAVATERWTGSWYTIFLTIDRSGGLGVTPEFEAEIREHIERYRMAGHDIEIDGPRFVWLEIELRVCVLPDYYRGDVRRELLDVFSSGTLPDGSRGFFHPDNFTFNQPVYLSRIYAAAQQVPGVRFVEALTFQRFDDGRTSAIDSGSLAIGRLEIARLDNDPSFPERGVLRLTMEGGR
jgi:hypothetical protein